MSINPGRPSPVSPSGTSLSSQSEVCLVAPPSVLRDGVVGYFSVTGASTRKPRWLLPDGGVDLVFNLCPVHGEPDAGAVGVLTFARAVQRRSDAGDAVAELPLLGVAFAPGKAFPFLGIPLHEFRDQTVTLTDLWGRDGHRVLEQLHHGATMSARVRTLSSFLEQRRSRNRPAPEEALQASIGLIRRRHGQISIRDLSRQVGIGERRLQRLFRERLGLSPKEFANVARLHAVLARLRRGTVDSWSALAADCGFADQAHLIRDFRRLTGRTPTSYLPEGVLLDSFDITDYALDRLP